MTHPTLHHPSPFTLHSIAVLFLFVLSVLCAACSSAPSKPVEIYTGRNLAASQLDMANKTANQGKYQDALILLEEARRLAVAADDPALRIKTALSRGNVYFSMGRHDEAFKDWESASAEGEAAGQRNLAALARIYTARGRLVLDSPEWRGEERLSVEEIRNQIQAEISRIEKDDQTAAMGWVALGMAEKELGRYSEAENAVRQALNIHEKGLFLEEAAYDWYLIASIRSVSAQYAAALEALRAAINFDRRAENGFGLASSWQAMGEVYLKNGQPAEA
ncbi:MAG: tetratricopeptide repeat protein, partial [Treponema sp.]|nr:tetratricopeptide repeat protein [Treponema sp.]